MHIPNSITRGFGRAALQSKKQSPHIFFVVGIIGIVGSTVLACRATLKLEKIVDEIQQEFKNIHQDKEFSDSHQKLYDQNAYMRDLTFAYIRGAQKMIKLYGPSAVVGGISIAALTKSHVQMSQRNAALTAALTAVSKAYEEYRGRVREAVGEKKELAIYQACVLDDPEQVNKLGELEKVGKVSNHTSPYGRFFEANNPNWQKEPEFNRIFIQLQQNYANHLLHSRGHVFLNEVYDALGMDRSQAGAVVGWVRNGDGDGYIDFGLYDVTNINFVNGAASGCLLDFNVDGIVYDKI